MERLIAIPASSMESITRIVFVLNAKGRALSPVTAVMEVAL